MNDTAKCVVQQIHSSNSLFLFFNVVQALCAVDTCGGRVVVLVHVVVDSKKRAVGPGRVVLGTDDRRSMIQIPALGGGGVIMATSRTSRQ
jgi:hypothetical protein